jgi:hypothetical protein
MTVAWRVLVTWIRKAAGLLSVTASLLAPPSVAEGDPVGPPPATIEWNAPQDCPDGGQLRRAVESMIGPVSEHRQASGLVARATVTRDSLGQFVLRMQIDTKGASETKTIEAQQCTTLADAFAVIVALATARLDQPLKRASVSWLGHASALLCQ